MESREYFLYLNRDHWVFIEQRVFGGKRGKAGPGAHFPPFDFSSSEMCGSTVAMQAGI